MTKKGKPVALSLMNHKQCTAVQNSSQIYYHLYIHSRMVYIISENIEALHFKWMIKKKGANYYWVKEDSNPVIPTSPCFLLCLFKSQILVASHCRYQLHKYESRWIFYFPDNLMACSLDMPMWYKYVLPWWNSVNNQILALENNSLLKSLTQSISDNYFPCFLPALQISHR